MLTLACRIFFGASVASTSSVMAVGHSRARGLAEANGAGLRAGNTDGRERNQSVVEASFGHGRSSVVSGSMPAAGRRRRGALYRLSTTQNQKLQQITLSTSNLLIALACDHHDPIA